MKTDATKTGTTKSGAIPTIDPTMTVPQCLLRWADVCPAARPCAKSARGMDEVFGLGADDDIVSYLPLCHMAEQMFGVTLPLQKGHGGEFRLLTKEFDHDDGEVTATVKVKRKSISQRYGSVIEAMYA